MRGERLPSPKATVSHTSLQERKQLQVQWYGGGDRKVRTVTGTGYWYRTNNHRRKIQPIQIRWVFIEDLTGTHRDEYFFSTDPDMKVREVVEEYVGRWSLETTFQEMHPYLGLESTRGWTPNTVLRAAPCLFGLYSLVVLLYCSMPTSTKTEKVIRWEGKTVTTFSDAITHVRRWLWLKGIFDSPGYAGAISKLTPKQRELLLHGLAPAL